MRWVLGAFGLVALGVAWFIVSVCVPGGICPGSGAGHGSIHPAPAGYALAPCPCEPGPDGDRACRRRRAGRARGDRPRAGARPGQDLLSGRLCPVSRSQDRPVACHHVAVRAREHLQGARRLPRAFLPGPRGRPGRRPRGPRPVPALAPVPGGRPEADASIRDHARPAARRCSRRFASASERRSPSCSSRKHSAPPGAWDGS